MIIVNIQLNTEKYIRITEQAADVDVTSFNLEQKRRRPPGLQWARDSVAG